MSGYMFFVIQIAELLMFWCKVDYESKGMNM